MSQPWFRFYHESLDDPKVQKLPGDAFRDLFLRAIQGEATAFSRHVKPGTDDRMMGPEWAKIRARVFKRDDYTCRYCGARGGKLECDHIRPRCRGGSDHPNNLKTACFNCNRSKGTKTLKEWMAQGA